MRPGLELRQVATVNRGKHQPGEGVLAGFHEPVREWFSHSFEAPTRVQELAWPVIRSGQSALVLAPTGSGKTLAAFLAAIDRLMFEPVPDKKERCRVLYVSPLKALAVDVERNLRAPLVGVSRYAERMGHAFHTPEVAIRTGDTPSRERARFQRNPADILITTPESLYLLLTSNAREALRSVRWVIVDEVHAVVGTKRGAHLALSLERLEEITGNVKCQMSDVKPGNDGAGGGGLQRIGLSATVRPPDEAARFLGGFLAEGSDPEGSRQKAAGRRVPEGEPEAEIDFSEAVDELDSEGGPHPYPHTPTLPHSPRPVTIVDAGHAKELDLTVEVAVEDMAKLGEVQEIPSGPAAQGEVRTSIWPAIHPMVLDLIRSHRSTLIFVNSRRLAERMAQALNELAGAEIVRAHHGSIAREQRLRIEDELKAGRLPAMVATSSLELGIDMGAIDLVIQVEAPPGVASAIQRIGRAGHHIGVPSKGVIVPKFRGDLLACAALTERMKAAAVEPLRYPRNPLDVLAQHVVAMVAMDEWSVEDLERLVRRAAPFTELPRSMLDGVLDMLSGRYPSDEFAELRPRITWDRLAGTLRPREGVRRVAIANAGTIPDRGTYGVFLTSGEENNRRGSMRVGELDEEMVLESHPGDTFILGASTWRIEDITHDRVLVSPAPGEPGRMPFWHGDRAGRPLEFGRAIGRLSRVLREMPRAEAIQLLIEKHSLTEGAARNLLQYLDDQVEAAGAVPDDRTILIERYVDEMGDWRVCILSPFGSRVHAPWAMAIGAMIRERTDLETDILWTDDGIVVRFPETEEPPPVEAVIPDPDEVEELVVRQLGMGGGGAREAGFGAPVNALFASRFREAAARALLLPRKRPGQRAPLWQQRKRAADLLHVTARFGSFPIVLETYRECLRDIFDMPALTELLRDIRRRAVRTVTVNSRSPSPFAASLLFKYVANFMYEGDAPLAERRAQALTVDPAQLRELLGEVELRELLDADALEELELRLQHLTEDRKARHADGLHDLLLRLGDLTGEEIQARSAGECGSVGVWECGSDAWLNTLRRDRRVIAITVAEEERFIAAEDAGRYRDALGIPPPPGLPDAFLEFSRDPLGELVARYARTHGPFPASEAAARFGLGVGPVLSALQALEAAGRVVEGAFRPGGSGQEWCDANVLRQLRQRSLARLRKEVEPVEEAALGRLYLAWQGIGVRRRGQDGLLEVIEQLQGAPLTASDLESRILPARLEGYEAHDLDMLTASGSVIWVGAESLGDHDGRISLYLTDHAPLLIPRRDDPPDGPLHDGIRAHLASRGASFYPQLVQACEAGVGGKVFQHDVLSALWDLVWAGEVTNDTLQPLRAYLHPRRRTARRSTMGRALRSRALFPPETSGRWSLVGSFLFGEPTATERLAARTRQLLNRYGVLTREQVQSEGVAGGFSAVYPVLKRMEESGHIRRGYFVSGRGATQFALPGAVDRLRALREPPEEPHTVILAATDPANPYGAALPWPAPGREDGETERRRDGETEGRSEWERGKRETRNEKRETSRRAARAAGAIVVLVDGALAAWMGRAERQLLTFPDQHPERDPDEIAAEIARALAEQVRPGGRRAIFVREVDGLPVKETPLAAALAQAGFTYGLHGYMKRL
jgi:ATP-dependent Lhr-like helicase